MIRPFAITCGVLLGWCSCAIAADANAPASPLASQTASGAPIEVTADGSLEWHQDKHLYIARGNAKAVRGDVTIEADELTAHERDKGDKAPATKESAAPGGDLDLLTADGNVRITDPRQKVFGERAVYDLDKKVAVITGSNLKYATPRDVITAKDALEYHEGQNTALARGKAVAIHDDRRVEADIMKAHFAQSPSGQTELTSMTAEGHVTVVTKNDISRGDRAVYDVKRNVAVMTGNVRVTRGETQLSGDKAEVDFTKGESRLLNQGHGRVRALLAPKTVDKGTKMPQ